jgi:hypothetical protein
MRIVDAHKYACGGVCRIVNEQENDQSVFKKVVATGSPRDESVRCADLWPVQLGAVFYRNGNGPQGRGYSGGYSGEKLYRQIVSPGEQCFPVATGLWPVLHRSVFHSKKNGPQGRGYSGRSISRLLFQKRTAQQSRGYSLLELTHDRCTRFRLGKANRLRMQQARL